MLQRGDILNGRAIPVKKIEVPDWGGEVYIRKLTAKAVGENAKSEDFESMVGCCIAGVCDESGKRIFTEDDRERLSDEPWDTVNLVSTEVLEFSGLLMPAGVRKKK